MSHHFLVGNWVIFFINVISYSLESQQLELLNFLNCGILFEQYGQFSLPKGPT